MCCSHVTYYSMPARSGCSCSTYKRFLHLASQVFTKYTACGLEFSQKNVSYAPGDSSKYFRQLPFLFLPLFLSISPSLAPRTNEVERIVDVASSNKTRWKKEEDTGLHERYVGSYFVMPKGCMNTETDAAGQSWFHKGSFRTFHRNTPRQFRWFHER